MSRRNPEDYREAVTRVETLYSICQILGRILKLVRKPDTGMNEIAELVIRDQALTADVLHLSNCALFRRGAPCSKLGEALQRLGVNELVRLIGISLSKNLFGKDLACYGLTASQYWSEAVWSALFNEALARRQGIDPCEAYVIGLLSPIGKALINEVATENGFHVLWDGLQPIHTWEIALVGFTHAEAAALLMRKWEFPPAIVDPILGQLEPPDASQVTNHSGLLRVTGRCLAATDPADVHRNSRPTVPEEFAAWFDMESPREFRALIDETIVRLEEIRSSLG